MVHTQYTLDENLYEILFAALWVVQRSGRYNMVTQMGDAWTAAMCILGSEWGQSEIVSWMNHVEGHAWVEPTLRWQREYTEHSARWADLAAIMPCGQTYLSAAARFPSHQESVLARDSARHADRHGQTWCQALVMRSEETCYVKGIWARDELELDSARGVSRPELLRAIGSQLA